MMPRKMPSKGAEIGVTTPFESMMSRFKIASEALGLDEEVYNVCQNCGGGGSITFGSNCIYVIKGNQINIVTDQALETNQNSFTNNEINLFPNPAKEQITIDFGTNLNVIGGNYKILNDVTDDEIKKASDIFEEVKYE